MYYEPYEKKPAKRRGAKHRKSFGEWLGGLGLRLLAAVLIALLAGAAILYALPPSLFAVEPDDIDLSLTDGLPASRENVLIMGVDLLQDNSQRSDAMIIASVGYGKLRLTSMLRDMVVDIPGHGSDKLNAAYAFGGPTLVLKTLNENFGLNLMHYIIADFVSLVEIVDAIGGVDLTVTEAEMTQINVNVVDSARVFKPLGYTATELTRYGESVHLDGLQALGYVRIRKIDSDFMRASRQRALLGAMVRRIRGQIWNPVMLGRLASALSRSVKTNMSVVELLSLGEKVLLANDSAQMRLPVENSYEDNGSSLRITDRNANIAAFLDFAYH